MSDQSSQFSGKFIIMQVAGWVENVILLVGDSGRVSNVGLFSGRGVAGWVSNVGLVVRLVVEWRVWDVWWGLLVEWRVGQPSLWGLLVVGWFVFFVACGNIVGSCWLSGVGRVVGFVGVRGSRSIRSREIRASDDAGNPPYTVMVWWDWAVQWYWFRVLLSTCPVRPLISASVVSLSALNLVTTVDLNKNKYFIKYKSEMK